jgi:hypothetical protein
VVTVIRTVELAKPVMAVGKPATTGQAAGQLARTGTESLPLAQVGMALIVVGFLLALLERNRRAARTSREHLNVS